MDRFLVKELIANIAQDQRTWNLYTQEGEFFDQNPPTLQDLSRAEEILIKRRDWRARKRLLAYTSRRLRQERVTASEASMLENTLSGSGTPVNVLDSGVESRSYMLLKRLVRPARVVGACVIMVSLAAFIIQNRETIGRRAIFSDRRALNIPNPTNDPGSVAYIAFQSITKEDQNFLDEILQKQNQDGQQQDKPASTQVQNVDKAGIIGSSNDPVLKGKLVINTAVNRPEPVTHKEAVKRAQLVTITKRSSALRLVRSQ
jgi:hypothetical protein